MGKIRAMAILGAVGILVAGCGTDVTQTDEFQVLQSERDALEDSLSDAEVHVTELDEELADREDEVRSLRQQRDDAEAEVEELRLEYDDEIRAELQSAFDAEVERACAAAEQDVEASIPGLVDYDTDWEPVGSRAELHEAVEACAADERAKTAEQREAERLAACDPIDVDAVVKDPDAYLGECLVVYAAIWQYDSRTGPCTFLASMSDQPHQRSFEYGEDGAFVADDDTCSQLDGVDADDHVKIWAEGAGPHSYDTAMGGSNEIPLWSIEKVELVRKE